MSDNFVKLIPDAVGFLKQLAANNNRDWFQAHKKEYESAVKNPATAFGAMIAARLSDMTGEEHTPKLFRINRDVRFSKDKTPYNTHLHLLWRAGSGPGWFFGASPEYTTAGCGIMAFDKDQLTSYRAAVDRDGTTLQNLVNGLLDQGYRMDDPALKRVPPPFDKDHPHGDLLRRKGFAIWSDHPMDGDPSDALMARFTEMMPLKDWLRTAAG